jgi:hypothetical protein
MSAAAQRWGRSAGLIAGPFCWGLNTQVAYSVASEACDIQRAILTPTSLTLIAISVVSALVSVMSARSVAGEWLDPRGGSAGRFVAALSCTAGLLFAVVIANQLAAVLILPACAR